MPRDQEKGATLVGRLVDAEEQLRGAWSAAVSHQVTVLNSNRRSLREKGVRAEPLEAYFRSLYRDRPELRVEALRLLPGAHSREVYFFDLIDSTGRREPVVLRRDREQNAVPTTVAEERPIMETLRRRGFPVPEVLAASEDNRILGRPFLAMRRLAGQELAQRSDLARYAAAAARLLAQLHQVPVDGLALPLRLLSPPLETAWPRLIEERFAIWRRFKPSSSVIMQHAYGWLQDHCQAVSSRFSCVHGDFQPQNLIVDDDQVVGLLDFEVCHLGHPAEDLLAIRSRIEAHVPWRDFFDVYLEQGGAPVSPAELSFCSVWVPFFYATIAATAYDTFLHHAGFDISTGAPAIMHLPPLLQMLTGALQAANTP